MNCGCKLSRKSRIMELPRGLSPRLLRGLPKADLDWLLSAAKHCRLRAGSVVLRQEEPAQHLFLLTSGEGRQFVTTKKGKKVLLFWLSAGQVFGGVSILSAPYRYLATTELTTDSCAWMWDRRTIREFVSRCPQFLDNTLSIAVTEQLAWFVTSLVSLNTRDARGRIAHLLMSLACGVGRVTSDGIELKISNEDLSAAANVTPFTVSRILSDWQRADVIVKGRGRILVRRPLLLASQ